MRSRRGIGRAGAGQGCLRFSATAPSGGSGRIKGNFASFGKETINNFNATQDVIDLPQSLFPNFAAVQADMHTSGANTVIVVDANDVITLSPVSITSLHASNFHFLL
jgi:hypothetical protein